jgi:hypothetical protein
MLAFKVLADVMPLLIDMRAGALPFDAFKARKKPLFGKHQLCHRCLTVFALDKLRLLQEQTGTDPEV